MGPPESLVLALQEQLDIREFVETGTFHGHTTAWAAGHFERVITIELSPDYHAAAVARFKADPRIRPLCGSSTAVLRAMVPALTAPAIFWLDAHWSGLDTAGREAECPLLAEIELLNGTAVDHVVLVDDARLFCAPPARPHRADQWPDLAAAVGALSADGRRYVVLVDDVLVGVPAAVRPFLVQWLQDAPPAEQVPGLLQRAWRKLRR
jgi:hypothetical protein